MNEAEMAALVAEIPEFQVAEPCRVEELRATSFTLSDAGYLEALLRGTPFPAVRIDE